MSWRRKQKMTKNVDKRDLDFSAYAELVKSEFIENKNKKAYVLTFGCQQNEADSEKLRGMAVSMGYSITDKPEDAELIVVNTFVKKQERSKIRGLNVHFKTLEKE